MATDISALFKLEGFITGSLVDANSGMVLSSEGVSKLDIVKASAGQAEAMQLLNMASLGNQVLDDVIFTLKNQYHIIRPLSTDAKLFLYIILDRKQSNLGMARVTIKEIEAGIKI
jgi:hypothetical protein